ncbi:hypothetical protein [Streptomyces griseus]|uniref:hypothetical protein n=1 Tax=Streptomyces griseus TaxID=1911 RepID=UPI0033AC9641
MTNRYVLDAVGPISRALQQVQDMGLNLRTDLSFAYTSTGAVARVADRSAAHRETVHALVRDAFVAAGWGVSVRYKDGLSLEHPSRMTRL